MGRYRVLTAIRLSKSARKELESLGIEIIGKNTCSQADLVVVSPATPWSEVEQLLLCSGARNLIVFGSGYDNIDLDWLKSRGICTWNLPDYISEAVAEHAIGLALALLRNIVRGDRFVREGEWETTPARELLGTSLVGIRAGIIGLGRVGARIAKLLEAHGVERPILYWSRRRKVEVEHILPLKYATLEEVFSQSKIVFISTALSRETEGLVDRDLIALMDKGYIVNIARGKIIDEEALLWGLREGRLAGAALDVFWAEPLQKNSPLVEFENVILTPHIAGYTRYAMEKTMKQLVEEITRVLIEKKKPRYSLTRC